MSGCWPGLGARGQAGDTQFHVSSAIPVMLEPVRLLQIEQLVVLTASARASKTLWQDEATSMQEDLCSVLRSFSTFASSDTQQRFAQGSLAELVLICNRLEGTLPQGMETLQILTNLQDMVANPPANLRTPAACVWDAEGARSAAAGKQQMEQSMKGLLFLQRTLLEPLSRQLVLQAYQILMQGRSYCAHALALAPL